MQTPQARPLPWPTFARAQTAGPSGEPSNVPNAEPPEPRNERRERIKLEKRLCRLTARAMDDYAMVTAGDRIMVCMSGGKDSHSLLDILLRLKRRAPFPFDVIAVNLDQKQPGFPAHILPEYFQRLGIEWHIEEQDTYSTVKRLVPEGETLCSLCSRLRRAALYGIAKKIGATKVALGHHRDDILQTFFLNLFHGSRLKAMPPKLLSDDGAHILIRPLAYIPEHDLEEWARLQKFPIIPCNLCGSQPRSERREIGAMLRQWEKRWPGRLENMARALAHITPSHLADPSLFDFRSLQATPHAPSAPTP